MRSTAFRPPAARTYTIEDLILMVAAGRVRVPGFQRLYRWDGGDVLALFDSVFRGYPVGSLLFWLRPGAHEVLSLGSLRIETEASHEVFWVVDGQQRIVSLANVLLATGEVADPRFALYFDLRGQTFARRGRRGAVPAHWLPMNRVIDSVALLGWLNQLPDTGDRDELVRAGMRLGKQVREYSIPASLVETDDDETLRTIFDRMNNSGKPLKHAEVFQALHGGRQGDQPEDLRTLGEQVSTLGFGGFDDNSLMRAVLALRGPDIYRDVHQEFEPDEDPTESFRQTAEALERTIGFLRRRANVPHRRVLPYRYVVPVLARFFHLHPEPDERSLILLRRWLWRGVLGEERLSTSVSYIRNSVGAVGASEHESVQTLLRMVPSAPSAGIDLDVSQLNDARGRAQVALLSGLGPRSLGDGQVLDLGQHFETVDPPLAPVVPSSSLAGPGASLANRMIHESEDRQPLAGVILASALQTSASVLYDDVLASHALPPEALILLREGDVQAFIDARAERLSTRLVQESERLAEWGATDRPPLSALVISDGDDDV